MYHRYANINIPNGCCKLKLTHFNPRGFPVARQTEGVGLPAVMRLPHLTSVVKSKRQSATSPNHLMVFDISIGSYHPPETLVESSSKNAASQERKLTRPRIKCPGWSTNWILLHGIIILESMLNIEYPLWLKKKYVDHLLLMVQFHIPLQDDYKCRALHIQ